MLASVERVDLDPAADFDQAKEFLGRVLDGTMPGFVLDTSGVTRSYLVEQFTPVLDSHNFTFGYQDEQVTVSPTIGLGDNTEPERAVKVLNEGTKDFAPHFDFPAWPTGPAASVVNLHYTTQGSVRGSFYELGPRSKAHCPGLMTNEMVAQIRAGEVNPEEINPRYYSALLTAGKLAVFCTGGRSPLIHHFETIESPRNSFVLRALNKAGMF